MNKIYYYYHQVWNFAFLAVGYVYPFTIGDNWRECILVGIFTAVFGTIAFLILPAACLAASIIVRFGLVISAFAISESAYSSNPTIYWLLTLIGVFNIYSAVNANKFASEESIPLFILDD